MKFKKLILLSCLLSLISGCILDQFENSEKIKQKFELKIREGKNESALDFAKRLTELEPRKYDSYLALAQAYAQINDKYAAIHALSNAIKFGLTDAQIIVDDPLLDSIKKSAGYMELMSEKLGFQEQKSDSINAIIEKDEVKLDSMISDTSTSITDKSSKTVIKAGDLEIEVDNE